MNLRKHIKDYFWSYAALGGVLGCVWVERATTSDHAANPYPMDLKVWLCGICHHVYDEEEEAEECCPDFKVGDIEGERDWWAEEILTPLGGIRPSKNTMWMCSQCGEDAHYYLEDEEVRIWDDYTFYCQECAESFRSEHIPTDLPLSFSTPAVNTQTCIAGNPYFTFGLCDRSPDGWGNSRGSYGDVGMGQPTCSYCKKVWATMDEDEQRTYISQFEDWGGYYDAESFGGIVACKQENCPHGHCPRCGNCDDVLDNEGNGSEHDDNPLFCGACGESFSAESKWRQMLDYDEEYGVQYQLSGQLYWRVFHTKEEAERLLQDVVEMNGKGKILTYRKEAESFQAPLFPKRKLRRSLRNACERCGDEGYRKSGISNTQCERCNRWVHNCCLLPSHDQHGEDVVSCQDCAENFASAVLPPVQTEGVVDAAMMHHYLQQRSILEQEVRYLEQELMAGRMTRKQFAMKLLELENRFSSEEEPKRKGIVRYMRGVPVKPRKLNGDPHPAEAAQKIDIGAKKPVEAIEVTWDSDNKPETEDPFSEVKWEAESMKKVGEHRVGRVIVEDCVDIRANKADAVGRYYRMRFRDPDDFENFRVPAWASRAANTIGRKYYDVLGSKITMGQTKGGEWMIQSVMVPRIPRLTPDGALVIANHIQDRIEREGQWAKADCQDEERVLMVS